MRSVSPFNVSTLGLMTLDELSKLKADNTARGSKYELSVKCALSGKKVIIKILQGETIISQEAATNSELHKALAEAHVKFHHYLNKKDREYQEFMELERPGWAARNIGGI